MLLISKDNLYMDIEIKSWLHDILKAIGEIESFLEDSTKSFADYQNDLRTRRAVERNNEIVGEALSRILKFDPTIAISNSRKIVDTRNRIVHGYDSVSDEVVWGITTQHIPVLKIEVQELLGV